MGLLQTLIRNITGSESKRIVILFDDGEGIGKIVWGATDADHELASVIADKLQKKYAKTLSKEEARQ